MLYFSKAKIEQNKLKRIAARYGLSGQPTTEERVRQLLRKNKKWGTILHACITVLEERGEESKKMNNSGRFAGAWVIQALQNDGIPPPSNLRTLASVGLIKLVSTSRDGNRAYYTIPDVKGVLRALKT